MAMQKERRHSVIASGRTQVRLTMQFVAYVYCYLVVFSLLANLSAIGEVVSPSGDEATYVAAVDRLNVFVEVFVLPLAITFVIMSLHGVLISQRLAGPVYRIKEVLKGVAHRDLARDVRIRDVDFFHDLCEEMNQMIGRVREDLAHLRTFSDEVAEHGEALAAAGELPAGSQRSLIDLTTATTRLRQLVGAWKLDLVEDPDPRDARREAAQGPAPAEVEDAIV